MKKRTGSSATYVYCVTSGARAPSLARAPAGLPKAGPPRSIPVSSSLWLVAADAPLDHYDEAAIRTGLGDLEWVGACAAGHERVVEHVARSSTAVPMKLFTLFEDDARAVTNARKLSARIARSVERIEGCVEWGVRVHLDERTARAASRKRATDGSGGAPRGTAFLRLKKAEHTGVLEAMRSARGEVDAVFAALTERARESIERPPVSREVATRVLLDAVFLVPSGRSRTFQQAVERARTSISQHGCEVVLSGPWPPYHFIEARRRSKR